MSDAVAGRVRLMVGRAILGLVNDATKAQAVQVEMLDDEVQDNVERFQNYGFTSVPHKGAEAVVVCVGGLRSHGIVIATEDRRYRLTGLENGEVALYDDQGQVVKLARDGIYIETDKKVTVNADSVAVTAETVEVNAESVAVTAESVVVTSNDINLGGSGGGKVARVGDTVAGGVITSGSNKVKAA
jgi:phage baseplate assembly protein V